ncbi:hypothetical protein B0T25DRAFT_524510 [Lasiosphaeria hispida]|uniref:BTB domain-containing protein n=1 Tax=Lasiosphaeria hispida TaxID=260671 RepID=A0AAJ0HTX4_9PEZI|nr:hypothetical protein B0T25DRAFT_524510 [Lasiosphaeria hispida]
MCDHTMDPTGDVIFKLNNPNVPLAIWDDEQPPVQATGPGPFADTPPAIPIAEPAISAENASLASNMPPNQQDSEATSQEDPQLTRLPLEPVTFLISSRHLILASPVFKAMLTGGWNEGDKISGPFQVSAQDWNAEAVTIVMNVLHNHYGQVPKTVTLKMLAKIAVIVDYYKIHEAFQAISQLWIDALRKQPLPTCLGNDVTLWILVSWVFEAANTFKYVTKVAVLRSREDVKVPHELPIPSAVIDRINQDRKDAMDLIAAGIGGLQQDYVEGRAGCDFECRAMHLGALMLSLNNLNFSGHPSKPHFGNCSLTKVVDILSGMKSPKWCTLGRVSREHQCPPGPPNVEARAFKLDVGEKTPRNLVIGVLNGYAALLVNGAKDKMEGLLLADFVSSTT